MALRCSYLKCDGVKEGWAPLMYRELGAKAKEITLEEKGVEDGAIGVLKGYHDRGGGMGKEGREGANLRGELHDVKVVIGGVVTKECLVAHLVGVSWGNVSDTSGNAVDKNLVPLDIWVGGECGGGWQGGLDGPDNDVMGSLELDQQCLWAGEHN
jgi:hypothetical protein